MKILFSKINMKSTNLEIFNSSLKSIEILKNFKNIVKFNSTENQIEVLNEFFINSKKLQIFIVRKNSGLLQLEFGQKNIFHSLLFIEFFQTNISEFSNKFFNELYNLNNLYIHYSIVGNIDKHLFRNLSNLRTLKLQNLKILTNSIIDSKNFNYLNSLHTLISSKSMYCCFFQDRMMNTCLPKREKEISSCNHLISSKLLKGKKMNICSYNVHFSLFLLKEFYIVPPVYQFFLIFLFW